MSSPLVVHELGSRTAPPLVLLHGLTEAGACWPDAVAGWAHDWRVLAVDLRGHGRSPRFTDAELADTCRTMVDDVLTVLASLTTPPDAPPDGAARGPAAVVVGHSLGAALAALAADRRPDLVRALVLEDPPPPAPRGAATVDDERAAFVADQHAFLDRFVDGPGAEEARMRTDSPWSTAEIHEWALSKPLVDRRMIEHLRLDLAPGDSWLRLLDRLTVPTLLVAPLDGDMAPDPRSLTNPRVRVETLPGVGHCVRRDDSGAYHALVDPFLAAARARERPCDEPPALAESRA